MNEIGCTIKDAHEMLAHSRNLWGNGKESLLLDWTGTKKLEGRRGFLGEALEKLLERLFESHNR